MSDSPTAGPSSSSTDGTVDMDWLLMLLVRIANSSPGWSIGVTLWLPGGPVTGQLVSGETWASNLEAKLDESGTHGLTPLFDILHEKYAALAADTEADRDDEDPQYIHLTNARFMSGPLLVPEREDANFTWRGRLSEVAGWAVGSLGSSPAQVEQ